MSKVTLKVGDKFSNGVGIDELITELTDNKIKTTKGSWSVPLRQDFYYVNGVRYAKEDIIVPTGEEFELITKDNIAEVLEYNGISDRCYYLSKNCISYNWSSTNSVAVWSSTLYFDNPKWLEHLEVEFGKLKPLPKKSNPFDVVKIGQWVRAIVEHENLLKNKWYQRISCEYEPSFFWYRKDDGDAIGTPHYQQWDLTDIRDYNPDEEIVLKAGDEVIFSHTQEHDIIERFDYIQNRISYKNTYDLSYFNAINNGHIQSVNGKRGKYVIPPFDFVQTLLDNGFKHLANTDVYVAGKHKIAPIDKDTIYALGHKINPTPENAKRIIDAANILNELE